MTRDFYSISKCVFRGKSSKYFLFCCLRFVLFLCYFCWAGFCWFGRVFGVGRCGFERGVTFPLKRHGENSRNYAWLRGIFLDFLRFLFDFLKVLLGFRGFFPIFVELRTFVVLLIFTSSSVFYWF